MPLPLRELFPDEDFRFHLTLRKGQLAEFFGHIDPDALAERRRWLADAPARTIGATAAAGPLVEEFSALAQAWLPKADTSRATRGEIRQELRWLGERLEPDFLLLSETEPLNFRLQAGVVCFPSAWTPEEKFGLGLESIHGVVPNLNPTLGATIGQFFQRLKPGLAFERANWGLAATPERNLHPSLARPRLTPELPVEEIWLRIEDQIFALLPNTRGVLFGIQLRIIPLARAMADDSVRRGFARALATLTPELAAYKGLAEIRSPLLRALEQKTGADRAAPSD